MAKSCALRRRTLFRMRACISCSLRVHIFGLRGPPTCLYVWPKELLGLLCDLLPQPAPLPLLLSPPPRPGTSSRRGAGDGDEEKFAATGRRGLQIPVTGRRAAGWVVSACRRHCGRLRRRHSESIVEHERLWFVWLCCAYWMACTLSVLAQACTGRM